MSPNDIISTIEVMRMQEETTYSCGDYLYQRQVNDHTTNGPLPTSSTPIDAECRSKMSQWCYQIVDFCKLNRETVAIAMNYLDRYLMTESGRHALESKRIYQLAAMTCLYTAVKLHEHEAMDPKMIACLSRGIYTEDQVTEMELTILSALEWRVNPPTAMAFVRQFFNLLPNTLGTEVREAAFDLARSQAEQAVHEYSYVVVKPSTIALAAFTNALASFQCDKAVQANFSDSIADIFSIDGHSPMLKMVQNALGHTEASVDISTASSTCTGSVKTDVNCGSLQGSPRSVIKRPQYV